MPTEIHQWENLRKGMRRFRVPDGWLYETAMMDEDGNAVALAFVPEPDPPEQDPELVAELQALQAEARKAKEEGAAIRALITELLFTEENEPHGHELRVELRKACKAVLVLLGDR